MSDILKVAGWSKETTFARFYNKPLGVTIDTAFAQAIIIIIMAGMAVFFTWLATS